MVLCVLACLLHACVRVNKVILQICRALLRIYRTLLRIDRTLLRIHKKKIDTQHSCVLLFCVCSHAGRVCEYFQVGHFCRFVELFCGYIGLFCE